MARSRNIKPGFFTNDVLGELPALTRLLFAGLWVICDREGRVEDRPKKIRAEVLPYDVCDANEMLDSLMSTGFIARYVSGGISVIQVLGWGKHQNPHVKEAPSTLPAMEQHQTSTIQEPDSAQPLPEPTGLIPSLLIPDSLSLDSLIGQDKPAKQSKRRTQLPDDFYPNESGVLAAAEAGVNIPIDLVKFTNHHKAKGSVMADWQAAWRTWVSNSAKFSPKSNTIETFAERDARNARKRWEEMTGRTHPDNMPETFEVLDHDHLMLGVSQ